MTNIKILSWNILNPSSFDGKFIHNNNKRIHKIKKKIIKYLPDIICLQEINSDFLSSLNSYYSIISQSWKDRKGRFGCAILKRNDSDHFTIFNTNSPTLKTKENKGIPYNRAIVYAKHNTFELLNLHLTMEYPLSFPSFERIIEVNYPTEQLPFPMLICGDFNCEKSRKKDWLNIINLSQTLGNIFIPELEINWKNYDHFIMINPSNIEDKWNEDIFNFTDNYDINNNNNTTICKYTSTMKDKHLITKLKEACSTKKSLKTKGLSDHKWIMITIP